MRLEVAAPSLQRAPLTLLLSVLGLTASCSENVLLGSACPLGEQTCILVEPDAEVSFLPPVTSTGPVDTGGPLVSMDGGIDSAVPSQAPTDAGDVSAPASFPSVTFYNLGFERRGGVGGDVVLSNTLSVLIPIAPVDTVFAMLPNWYACVPLAVSSLTWMNRADAGSEKSEYGDYLSFVINGTAVRQQLGAPLTPGTSYSFEAKVATAGAGTASLHLEVQGSTSVCGAGSSLGRSAPLDQSERWTRACVTFTADKPYTYLLLAPSHDGAAPPGSARLYLDELRQVASCGAGPSAGP
jgi:hypothetical protein